MKPFDAELVSGNILRSVWKLAWPMILLNLINGVHGLVDHLLVGNFVPSEANEANAGIGVAWQLFLVVVVFIASLFQGMNVLVARYAGRQDREAIGEVVYHTLLATLAILVPIMAPLGYLLAPHLLEWFNTSAAVRVHALPYMRVLFTCGTPLFLMFLLTGALQASGNPKIPLALGVLTTVLNILLSTVLITVFKMGAIGAALGTCLAPCVSVVIALRIILRGKAILRFPRKLVLVPDIGIIRTVARIGIPTGLQAVVLNLGGALLLAVIGTLEHSAAAQAAYTICYTQLFSFVLWPSFGLRNAAATVIGQNIGAGKTDSGKTGVYVAAAMGLVWAVGLGIVYWVFPKFLLGLFDAEGQPVLGYGAALLRYLAFSGMALTLALVFTGGLQGTGDTRSPMYIAIVTQIGVLLGICGVAMVLGRLCPSVIWCAILVSHASRFLLSWGVFRRGKWDRIRVELETQ